MPVPLSRGRPGLVLSTDGLIAVVTRAVRVAAVVLLACHLAAAPTWASRRHGQVPDGQSGTHWPAARITVAQRVLPAFGDVSNWDADLGLSPAARRVSLIAWRNGDRDFLMVDKPRGRIILFKNGRPVFNRPALTGASLADRIPRDEWYTSWSRQVGVRFKATPAGRFTLTRGYDRVLGGLFDINGLQGPDWTIAIHRVWLGKLSERREVRLRSDLVEDKHITNGCIDVDPSTIALLWRVLPGRGMPLYILPNDENLIADLFQPETRRPGPRS